MRTQYDVVPPAPFRHTQFAVYLSFLCGAVIAGYDSAQVSNLFPFRLTV